MKILIPLLADFRSCESQVVGVVGCSLPWLLWAALSPTPALAQAESGSDLNRTPPRQSTPDPYFSEKTPVQRENVPDPAFIDHTNTGSETGQKWSAPGTPVPTEDPPRGSIIRNQEPTSAPMLRPLPLPGKSADSSSPLSPLPPLGLQTTSRPTANDEDRSFAPPSRQTPSGNEFSAPAAGIGQPSALPTSTQTRQRRDLPSLTELEPNLRTLTPSIGAPAKDEPEVTPFEPGKVLAIVGGEPIFVGDLMFEINQMIEKHMPTAPEPVKEKQRQQLIPRVLPKFVEAKILYQGSLQRLPEELQDNIDQVIEKAGEEFDSKALPEMMESAGIASPTEFDAHLRAQSSSLRQLRKAWSIEQLTKHFIGQQLSQTEPPTHEELLAEYRKELESYEVPARAKWEQIMIRFDRVGSRREAEAQLVELGNKLVNGANFEATAKSSSHGFRAHRGGQHDWTSRNSLVLEELDDAIFSIPVGELSDIIETRDGLHIVRVHERTEATRTPFRDAQVDIKKKLIEKKRIEAFQKYVAELKQAIPVEYLD